MTEKQKETVRKLKAEIDKIDALLETYHQTPKENQEVINKPLELREESQRLIEINQIE